MLFPSSSYPEIPAPSRCSIFLYTKAHHDNVWQIYGKRVTCGKIIPQVTRFQTQVAQDLALLSTLWSAGNFYCVVVQKKKAFY